MEIVSIPALWMPILVSAVFVFLVSWLVHTMLKYHENDYVAPPDQEAVIAALTELNIPPGQYVVPKPRDTKEFKSPEFREKTRQGPAAFMTVLAPGKIWNMGPGLAMWFGYTVLIGVICAYLAGRTLGPDPAYLDVFRVVGTVAFACFAMAEVPKSIWMGQKWSNTFKTMLDGLIYALVMAGTFGWLWPSG